jgi:serine/threonine protein kinase/Tol biopolymer transport system component
MSLLALAPGDRIGPYEIVAPLGSGGMGEVYRARDGKLNRDVAIKVLPDAFALDVDRLARFTREAQTLASLNHPNIAAIYGIEGNAIVMELVEGRDLSALIGAAHPLDLRDALVIARQIAEALEAAHDAGVVHRDLKPANIKVRDDGTVKVLDFGLAKAMDTSATSNSDAANSPTLTAHMSQMGLVIGTAAYMAPEQAKGRPVDKRADIWAFGVILYEMLSGQRGYQAEDVSDTLAAVLTRDVNWSALPAGTPPRLTTLLRDCLMRDTKQRLRDIGDARRVIGQLLGESPDTSSGATHANATPVAARRSRTLLAAAALVVVSAAAAILLWNTLGPGARGSAGTRTGSIRLSVSIPPTIHATRAAISKDGKTVIIVGNPRKPDGTDEPRARVYTRRLDDYEFKPIPGTDGVQNGTQSPDGRWLAFIATGSDQSTQLRIAKVPVDGSSPPVVLSDWSEDWDPNVVWLEDGDILVGSSQGTKFFRLPTNGGAPTSPMAIDTGSASSLRAFGQGLPGDRGVFFSMESWGPRGYQLDQWLLDPKTGKAKRLFENAGNARYVPDGYIAFSRGAVLMAAPFDLQKLEVTGAVTALPGSVRTLVSWAHGAFSLSDDGTLVSAPGGRLGTDRSLVTVDPSGQVTKFVADARSFESTPRVSPDGRAVVAVISNSKGTYETWVAEAGRPSLRRALALPNADCGLPVWSQDGQWLAYQRTARDMDDGIYLQRADGSGEPQAILKSGSLEVGVWATSFAPDGSGMIVSKFAGGKGDILFVPISATGSASTPRVLRATPALENDGRFSPDGRLVAFSSDESGRDEVYVADIRADGALGPATMVSSSGGLQPAWANGGRRLFYYNDPNRLMSVDITVMPRLSASAPVMAYDLKKLRVNPKEWDVMPDGRLLAIQKGEGEGDITDFNIVLNWSDELRARMTMPTSGR